VKYRLEVLQEVYWREELLQAKFQEVILVVKQPGRLVWARLSRLLLPPLGLGTYQANLV
jgi:hypothetical protein